jgi:hypothetical protein
MPVRIAFRINPPALGQSVDRKRLDGRVQETYPSALESSVWHGSRVSLLARLRDYLHLACHSAGLPTSIVPHQLRHTYGTEMLRAGVGFAAVMKLLGHTDPGMTMRYVDVTLTDLQREFQLARSQPRHLAPQPKTSPIPLRTGHDGLIDSLLAAQHLMLVFRRSLPNGHARSRLDRLANQLTKMLAEIRKLQVS